MPKSTTAARNPAAEQRAANEIEGALYQCGFGEDVCTEEDARGELSRFRVEFTVAGEPFVAVIYAADQLPDDRLVLDAAEAKLVTNALPWYSSAVSDSGPPDYAPTPVHHAIARLQARLDAVVK